MSLEKVVELKDKILKLKDEAKVLMKKAFEEGCVSIFEKYPSVKSFGWIQYTPYFNDGDECNFGVHYDLDWGLSINGEQFCEIDQDDSNFDILQTAADEICEFIRIFDDSDNTFKSIFGDHVSVTITPEGAYADGYRHD